MFDIIIVNKIKDWFFPNICCLCYQKTYKNIAICDICDYLLPKIKKNEKELKNIENLYSLYNYRFPLTKLINKLKFGKNPYIAKALGTKFAEYLYSVKKNSVIPEVIIPMPLHKKRLQERGYNQALEIALPISKLLNIPIDINLCYRLKYTSPQARLNKIRRKKNIENAFRLKLNNKKIKYKHIAIVDDVITTGNTIKELEKLFLKYAVSKIEFWVLSRA